MEASQNKEILINNFAPGWAMKRGTASLPNAPIVLHNALVDYDDSIIARGGIKRINTTQLTDGGGSGTSNAVHSMALQGATRYVGVGTVIRRGIDPGTIIVRGLSNARITMASMSPSTATPELWTYFANGNVSTHGASTGDCRKTDNGSSVRNWGIDGPDKAVTLALAAEQPDFVLIDSMASAYSALDTGTESTAAEPYNVSARSFTVTTGNTCRFRRSISTLDVSVFGEEGFIRLMIRLSRIADTELLGVAFDVNDGTFTKDFYVISTRQIGFTGDNIWSELRIRKADFVRVKSSGGSDLGWENVKAIQFMIGGKGDITNPFVVSVDDLRVEDITHPDGVFDYKMTWWNDDIKIRSNSRSLIDVYNVQDRISETLASSHQRIKVTRVATTTDPQVTHWELWRRNYNQGGIFLFVDRIAKGTAVYNDDFADTQLGEELIEDNHIPPPARFCVSFDDRMFLMGLKEQTLAGSGSGSDAQDTGEEQAAYTVRYSPRFRPESFPLTNYFLAGDPVDTIRGFAIWQSQMWIFTKRHVYRVTPVGNSYVAQLTEAPIGTESPYAISPSPYGIFYLSPGDGPYLFNGSTATCISSERIQPFFDGEVIQQDGIAIQVAVPDTVTEYTNVVGQYHNRFYTMVIDDTTGTCRTLIYNVEKQRWHRIGGKDLTIQRLSTEKAGDDLTPANNLEAGNADGWLLLLEPLTGRTSDHDNEPISVTVQQTFDVLMKPSDVEVDVKDIIVDANTNGQVVMVEASFDDAPLEVIGTGSAQNRQKIFIPVHGPLGEEGQGRICYKVSVRLTIEQTTFRCNIFGIGLNYWPEPRRSTVYSSMWFAPVEKAWIRRGRLVVRSYAPVDVQLIFDDTRRYDFTLPNTQGSRLGYNPTVPTGLLGKVARVIFSSESAFVVYPQSFIQLGTFGSPAQIQAWQVQP